MASDFQPFEILNPEGDPDILLIGDHVSNALPPEYGDLGLPAADWERHIAYDVGTYGVLLRLSKLLNAPAVMSCFSRLLIDPNRGEDDPTLLMKLSDGAIIPGNRHADAAEIERRLERYHRPYHAAVSAMVDRAEAAGGGPAIFSIHSFTPQLHLAAPRPWQAAVLWREDDRLAKPLLRLLQAEKDLCVGENQPYPGGLEGDTMDRHAIQRGIPHGLLEIRNDLITAPDGQIRWAERLAPLLKQAAREVALAPV